MAHGNGVFFDNNLFDQQADDFLFILNAEALGAMFDPSQESVKRVVDLPKLFLRYGLPVCAFQFLLCCGLLFTQGWHPLAQFRQSEQSLLVGVQ